MITVIINNNDGSYQEEREIKNYAQLILLMDEAQTEFGIYQVSIGVATEEDLEGKI